MIRIIYRNFNIDKPIFPCYDIIVGQPLLHKSFSNSKNYRFDSYSDENIRKKYYLNGCNNPSARFLNVRLLMDGVEKVSQYHPFWFVDCRNCKSYNDPFGMEAG